jgi:radical SAM protein with 4Fe4S-binding SPASM domain
MPMLAELYHEGIDRGLLMIPGNNIGYFGPYEHIWRSFNQEQPHWTGCSAGQTGLGLESDGTVKGCPSLSTVGYAGGNIRELSLEDIWRSSEELHFGRLRSVDSLWGFCRSCYYAELCRGGCTWTADSLFGRPGNNPYCHYRVLELEKRGLRERVAKKSDALQQPFAIGAFELITEPIPGAEATSTVLTETISSPPAMPLKLVQLTGRTTKPKPQARDIGEVPPQLEMCHACNYYIWPGEVMCPHCGGDVKAALATYQADAMRRSALIAEVEGWIRERQSESTGGAPELTV